MSTIIKETRKIFTGASGDPSLASRVTTLENNELKITYFQSISSTSGTITIPTGATILLDQFQAGADAYVSTITNGRPTGEFPQTSGGVIVDVTSFDALGNYTLTGTPSSYPVALIFILKIKSKDYQNLTTANIIDFEDYNLFLNSLQIGNYSTPYTGGSLVIGKSVGSVTQVIHASDTSNLVESSILLVSNGNNITSIRKLGTNSTNLTGTSLSLENVFNIVNTASSVGDKPIYFTGNPIVNTIGSTSTNYGTRLDANGFRIDTLANLHTSNTYVFQVGGMHWVNNGIIYSDPYEKSFLQLYDSLSQIGNYDTRAQYVQTYISNIVQNIEVLKLESSLATIKTNFKVDTQAGTGNRLVQADSLGNQSAVSEIIEAWITDVTAQGLLETGGNWTGVNYTGTAITGTYQGQQHYDASYYYIAVADDDWIRIARA